MITNAQIVQTIKDAIEPLDFVYGLFEGGAIAFGRDDEYSDIDLHIVAADDQVTAVLPIIEKALVELGPLRDKYEVPQPTWHGHHQTFFRLEGHPDWLMVDCAVINHSAEDKFLEPEVHGHHVVHFDKTGIHESLPVYDYSKTEEAIKSRLQSMGPSMQMFSHLPSKFLLRGKNIDAIHFYNGFILRPLLVLLRIKYDPKRYDLSARYLYD
ncbi:MAG: hypothetical protein AAGD96_28280 [Chloroflexota bacterium]